MKEKYLVYYQHDSNPNVRRSCIIYATSGRDAVDRFYNIYNPRLYTAFGSGKLKDECKKEKKKMDLTKKITVSLTEDDIKEIVAHVVGCEISKDITKDNVELVYCVNTRGTGCNIQYDGCLKECKVKC